MGTVRVRKSTTKDAIKDDQRRPKTRLKRTNDDSNDGTAAETAFGSKENTWQYQMKLNAHLTGQSGAQYNFIFMSTHDGRTDRPTDRSTDRPTDRPTHRPTDPPTDRSRNCFWVKRKYMAISDEVECAPDWPVRCAIQLHLHEHARRTDRPTDRPIDRPTDRPTDPPTHRPTDRLTDRKRDRHGTTNVKMCCATWI